MSKPYFREIPDFEYINRSPNKVGINDYVTLKNLFKRPKISEDILSELSFFEKYSVEGNERPDNVADKFYNDPTLDWIVLIANNIINVRSEWPLEQTEFENFLIEKYGSYQNLYDVHHYETIEVTDSSGYIILPGGLRITDKIVDYRKTVIQPVRNIDTNEFENQIVENPNYNKLVPYFMQVYDPNLSKEILYTDILKSVSNYEYELDLQEKKRQIYILKSEYLNIIFNDLTELMQYKKGSGQYVSRSLKKADNINLG